MTPESHPSPAVPPRPPLNRLAVWALVASALLLFPVGAVLGGIAVFQIRRSGGRQEGLLLAGLALFMSVVVMPLAFVLIANADPSAFSACRGHQHDAEGTLRVVRFLEEGFREEHGRYGTLEEIGFTSMFGEKPYRYSLAEVTDDAFRAIATGNGEMEGDLLEVRSGGKVTRVVDMCHGANLPRTEATAESP